jgi:hypothetical protein
VALLAAGWSATDTELALAGLESSGVDVRVIRDEDMPLGGVPAALAGARADAAAALQKMHAAFVATRFAEARAVGSQAEARLRRWGGDAEVSRALAELALIASVSGDAGGVARAVSYAPALQLDEARWNPEVRRRWDVERVRRQAAPRMDVEIESEPADALVLVDGSILGRTPLRTSLTRGHHAVELRHAGFAMDAEEVDLDDAGLRRTLEPLGEDARLGELRLRMQEGERATVDDLTLAARLFDCDAALAFGGTPRQALLAGPHVVAASFDPGALREVAAAAGRRVQTECSVTHAPPESGRAASSLALKVRAGACVARVHAAVRAGGRAPVERTATVGGGDAVIALGAVELPSSAGPYTLQYRLWGETFLGHATQPLGSESAPLRVRIDADRAAATPRRWYQKWWIWTIAGGALAAAAVITAVTVYRPPSEARLVGP